jgi:hypothetical protein
MMWRLRVKKNEAVTKQENKKLVMKVKSLSHHQIERSRTFWDLGKHQIAGGKARIQHCIARLWLSAIDRNATLRRTLRTWQDLWCLCRNFVPTLTNADQLNKTKQSRFIRVVGCTDWERLDEVKSWGVWHEHIQNKWAKMKQSRPLVRSNWLCNW